MYDILTTGLIQQIPVAVILVYAMHRFLSHLEGRDKNLGEGLKQFASSIAEMNKEISHLAAVVIQAEKRNGRP